MGVSFNPSVAQCISAAASASGALIHARSLHDDDHERERACDPVYPCVASNMGGDENQPGKSLKTLVRLISVSSISRVVGTRYSANSCNPALGKKARPGSPISTVAPRFAS